MKNAEASAQAKVIDSKAELEKRDLMAEAEAHRVRLLAGADAERMKSEAQVLKESPLRETAHIGMEAVAGEPVVPEVEERAQEGGVEAPPSR